MDAPAVPAPRFTPWNKGRLVGPKPPLKLKEIWAIRIRLQLARRIRDLALFNLGLDSKLRACDLVSLRVADITVGSRVANRATVFQRKTQRPVQFELTEHTRDALSAWIAAKQLRTTDYLFPSRVRPERPLSRRQYGRIVDNWITSIGLDPAGYGTHTMRRPSRP